MGLIFRSISDLVAPHTCRVCGRRIGVNEMLFCTLCKIDIPFTKYIDDQYENALAKVFWKQVKHIEKAFALVFHFPHSRSSHLIYKIKYYGQPQLGIEVGEYMAIKMKEGNFFDGIDCLLPIPLSENRLKERGYNQSEMIAKGIRQVTGLPILKNVVKRIEFNASQTSKGRYDRYANVANAFRLVDGNKLKGKHVLVVDDVVTTGSTMCAFAKTIDDVEGIRISIAVIGFAGDGQR